MRRTVCRMLACACLLAAGCGGRGAEAGLDAIEERIERLEKMFPASAMGGEATREEIVTEAPEWKEEDRSFFGSSLSDSDLPPDLPPEVRAQIEAMMRGEEPPGPMRRIRILPGDTQHWETTVVSGSGALVIPRTSMPAVAVGGRVHVLGGYGPGEMLEKFRNDVETIDADLAVRRKQTGLIRRRYHVAEVFNDRIYIMGGQTTSSGSWRNSFPDVLEIFDPASGRIETGAPLPSSRYLAASAILGGKIFLVGGSPPQMMPQKNGTSSSYQSTSNSPPDNRLFIYDIVRNRWTEGAAMAVARQCDLLEHGGRLYAVAGYDGERSVAAFECYDPGANRWTRLPDLPFPMSAHRSVVIDDILFCFGDYSEMSRVCAYDFQRRTWGILGIRIKPMRHGAVVRLDDRILVIGGNGGKGNADYDGGAGADPLPTIQSFTVAELKSAAARAFASSSR